MRLPHFRHTAPLALAAGLLIALPGCGSDDSTTGSTSSAAPSKDEFIATVDQICTDTGTSVAAELQQQFPGGVAPPTGDEIENFLADVTIPALADQYEQIGAQTPPEGDEEQVQAIVDAGNEAVDKAEKDPESLVVLTGFKTPFDEVNKLEQEYGFKVCGAEDPNPDDA